MISWPVLTDQNKCPHSTLLYEYSILGIQFLVLSLYNLCSEHLERLCTLFFYTVQHEHMHPGVKYNKTQLSTAIHQKSTLGNAWFVPRTTATRVKHCMASIRRALWEMLDLFLKPLPQQSSTAVQQRALWEMLDMFLEPLPQESSTFSQQRALWEMLDIFL